MTWSMSVVPAEGVDLFWERVAPLLAPALLYSGGRIDADALYEGLILRRYLLWVVMDDDVIQAAFATRTAAYPRRRMLAVDCAGGSRMREWLDLVQQTFRNYARDTDCDGVEMYGRPGWERALSRYGWKRTMVIMEVGRAAPQEVEV
jgi:hypothetical protein